MASLNTVPRAPLPRTYPQDSRQHAASLMRDFDAIALTMDKLSQGVTEGISRTMQDLPGETSRELEATSFPQILIGEMSNSLSVGVPRRLFDALHQSFSELNYKLASRVEIDIASECHDSDRPSEHRETSRPIPSATARSLGHSDSCEDVYDTLEPSERENDGTIDRCCLCHTPASEEGLITTTCCQKSVGSICFQEWQEETGKCCLCQAYQPRSDTRYLATASEDTTGYKHHFITENLQDETNTEADVENARAVFSEQGSSLSPHSAVAQFSQIFPNASETLRAIIAANRPDLPKDPITLLSQSAASQQSYEPAKNDSQNPPNSSTLDTATVYGPPAKLQASLSPKEETPHSKEGDNHYVTESHRLKLIDTDVIYYLKEVREGDLLDLVHSALIERLRQTVCKGFFHQARSANGKVDVLICLKCSQEPDLKHGMKDWPRAFESFVLISQLQSFKVTVDHIQISTMKILQSFEKSTTIQTLVKDNDSVLKSLTSPADIRGICWNKKIIGLNPNESTSITITFRTAQQANEAIEHGILWHYQRRLCRRQGAHPRITQCGHCQAYGHIFKDCSSTPRCLICAENHLSTACAHDAAANKVCLKCVLCSGRHEATSENCVSRKIERKRLLLENRFYTTGAARAEQGGAASAA